MHTDVLEHPEVEAARRSVEQALRDMEEAERRASDPPLTVRRIDHAKAVYRAALAALHDARQRVAHQKLAKLEPKYVEAAKALAEAVEVLAPINAKLAELYERGRQLNGGRAPWPELALPEFLPPTPNSATKLSGWLPNIKRYVAEKTRKRLSLRRRKRVAK